MPSERRETCIRCGVPITKALALCNDCDASRDPMARKMRDQMRADRARIQARAQRLLYAPPPRQTAGTAPRSP